MNILLIIFFILSVVLAFFAFALLKARKEAKNHNTSVAEEFVGICSVTLERSSKKTARKERIIEILKVKNEASNQELREALGVSRQAIVKYTSELEAEGRIRQIGQAGRWVTYQRV